MHVGNRYPVEPTMQYIAIDSFRELRPHGSSGFPFHAESRTITRRRRFPGVSAWALVSVSEASTNNIA